MKAILPVILAIIVVLSGCDNTLEVTAPWKDIPIVHGILSPNDTAHYVRIEKAFLDPNQSALEIARIPDSIYYPALEVTLVNVSNGEEYPMLQVDATNEGYPREDGVFAEAPNYLYKVADQFFVPQARQTYRLEIVRSERLPLITADAEVVARPLINRPLEGQLIRFVYNAPYKVLWQEANNAAFYDIKFVIHYEETPPGEPGVYNPVSLDWKLGQYVSLNTIEFDGIQFYQYMAAELEANPSIFRRFVGIDVEVNAGGPELYEFRTIQQANTGVTSIGGDIPTYSNLSEGFGIFTSSNADINLDYQLHPESLDSLKFGYLTEDLNFQ